MTIDQYYADRNISELLLEGFMPLTDEKAIKEFVEGWNLPFEYLEYNFLILRNDKGDTVDVYYHKQDTFTASVIIADGQSLAWGEEIERP